MKTLIRTTAPNASGCERCGNRPADRVRRSRYEERPLGRLVIRRTNRVRLDDGFLDFYRKRIEAAGLDTESYRGRLICQNCRASVIAAINRSAT